MGRADRSGESLNERGIQPKKKTKSFFDEIPMDPEKNTITPQKKTKSKKTNSVTQTKKLNKTSQP